VKIQIPAQFPEAFEPRYQTSGSAGADLRACIDEPLTIRPGQTAVVPTGVRLAIPEGYEGQVRPRSGLARRQTVTLVNSPGTVDSDYRGEIQVLLINLGHEPYTVQVGERVAQLVVCPCLRAEFLWREELEASERGDGGFGSTGTS
jgi:dUTP pyrophosphatase